MRIVAEVLALLFILSLSAFGQAAGSTASPSMTNPYAMTGHPEHATQHALSIEQSLLPSGGETSAQGERPLSDFCTTPEPPVSLGQIAREYRNGTAVQRPIIRVIP